MKFKTLREFLRGKSIRTSVMIMGIASCMMGSAFAAEGDEMATITASLTTGFAKVATDILALLGVAVVAAIGIIGVKVAIKVAIGFFKTLASK